MRTLKLHFDGWIHIPADLLARLGGGERIEVRRVDGGLFVGPAGLGPSAAGPEPSQAVTAEGRDRPELPAAGAVKRGRGRPRKSVSPPAVTAAPIDEAAADVGSIDQGPIDDGGAERRSSLPQAMRPPHSARGRRSVGARQASLPEVPEIERQG